MIETVTAFLGLISAGIFLPTHLTVFVRGSDLGETASTRLSKGLISKFLMNSDQYREWQVYHA
jgi:hypothetical protein